MTTLLTGSAASAVTGSDASDVGFRRVDPRTATPRFRAGMVEAAKLWAKVNRGSLRARADLIEALATDDFPIFLNAVFERETLQRYEDITPVWTRYMRRTTVKDFKPKKFLDLMGGRAALSQVAPGTEFPARSLTEAEYEFAVAKYGARIPLLWEMLVNDDLDAFRDLPDNLSIAARDTESIVALSALFDAAGPLASFWNVGNGNAPDNKPLTSENLEAALTAISTRRDDENRPIVLKGAVLLVPPALEMTARRILNATEIRRQQGTGSGSTITTEQNYMRDVVELVVEPWITNVTTDAKANTRWTVLPSPSSPRPAAVLAFLRGYETPDLRVKADAGNRVNGGAIDPTEGSFDIDDIQYRVRHVVGSGVVDPIATYVSNGS